MNSLSLSLSLYYLVPTVNKSLIPSSENDPLIYEYQLPLYRATQAVTQILAQ